MFKNVLCSGHLLLFPPFCSVFSNEKKGIHSQKHPSCYQGSVSDVWHSNVHCSALLLQGRNMDIRFLKNQSFFSPKKCFQYSNYLTKIGELKKIVIGQYFFPGSQEGIALLSFLCSHTDVSCLENHKRSEHMEK